MRDAVAAEWMKVRTLRSTWWFLTGGVLAMLFLGAIIGGIIAFMVAALAAFSERVAETTSTTDRTIARLLIIVVTVGVWLVLVYAFKVSMNVRIG